MSHLSGLFQLTTYIGIVSAPSVLTEVRLDPPAVLANSKIHIIYMRPKTMSTVHSRKMSFPETVVRGSQTSYETVLSMVFTHRISLRAVYGNDSSTLRLSKT